MISSTEQIRKKTYQLSKELREDAASLIDVLHVPDVILKSSLGVFDGNIYETYLGDMQRFGETDSKELWDNLIKPRLDSKL